MAFTNKKEHWLEVIFRDKVELPGDEGVIVPSGTTAERPTSPDPGIIRYNTTDVRLEAYENGTWGAIGQASGSAITKFTDLTDTFSSYVGRGLDVIRVNSGETDLESIDGDTLWLSLANGGIVSSDIEMAAGSTITNLPLTPLGSKDATSKSYVDSISAGLDPKESCRAATTSNLTSYASSGGTAGNGSFTSVNLTGPLTDGVSMDVDDRVLVKDQTDPRENGIYIVTIAGPGGSMERSSDMDSTPANEVSGGNYTFVETGSQSGTGWVIVFDGTIILNSHDINWSQFSGAGSASLAGLTDTVITSALTGDYLRYDGADWINVDYIPRLQNSANDVYVDTDAVTGRLDLKAADVGAGTGGAVLISAGDATTTGTGGAVTITSGYGKSGGSGVLTLRGATAITEGIGGDINVAAGNAAGDRRGGSVSISAGDTSGSNVGGGTISLTTGTSAASGPGGDINITCSDGTGGAYEGGSIYITPGGGSNGGTVSILPYGGNFSSELRFYEGSFSGSEFLGLKSPNTVTASTTWTLPDGDGSASQYLQTDGSGNLGWETISVSVQKVIQDSDGDTFVSTDYLTGDSDNLRLQTGIAGASGNGGLMEIFTGDGGSAAGNGGAISMKTGSADAGGTGGTGGDLDIISGAGHGTGRAGNLAITSGTGGNGGGSSAGGRGGNSSLVSGDGGTSSIGNAGNAGNMEITAGTGGITPSGTGNGGYGGNIIVTCGNGGSSNGGTHGFGGALGLYSGDGISGISGSAGGNITVNAGQGKDGGDISISAGASSAGVGGTVSIYTGSSSNDANGADVNIHASDGSTISNSNQRGGNVTLKAGNGTTVNGDGGKIVMDIGSPQGSGDRGHVDILSDGLGTNGGEIRLSEGNGSGKGVGFKAPLAVPSTVVWELPNQDGSVNQIMETDGSGTLSFTDQVYDVGGSIIGAPISTGDVWRFSVLRAFTLNANAGSTAFCDTASTATASATFEIHLLAIAETLIPGLTSGTCIGSLIFGIGSQTGVIVTWAKGTGVSANAPVSIPATTEMVLHYPIADATLGNVSCTFEGNL